MKGFRHDQTIGDAPVWTELVMQHASYLLQGVLCFSAGVGAKTLFDSWAATRRKG